MTLADRIARELKGSMTVEEIARAVRSRTADVRWALSQDSRFSGPHQDPDKPRAMVYWLRPIPSEAVPARKQTHNEKVLALLSDGQPHTHHELYALHVIAHSRVADLRGQGYEIAQWRTPDGYCYQLVGSAPEPVGSGSVSDGEERTAATPESGAVQLFSTPVGAYGRDAA